MNFEDKSHDDPNRGSSPDLDEWCRTFETPNVVNPDNKYLHAQGPIGHVDEVNGWGAAEVPAFVPTRYELIQVVKHWTKVALDLDFWCFVHLASGSREIRLIPFAHRRIARIAECLGDAVVGQACREVEEEFAEKVDARAWQVFRHGTPEEQRAFEDERARELSGDDVLLSNENPQIDEYAQGRTAGDGGSDQARDDVEDEISF
jgi:hypothetical protein